MEDRLFCFSFWLFYNNKSWLSVCGETTANLLEQEFNQLLYGTSQVHIDLSEHQRQTFV